MNRSGHVQSSFSPLDLLLVFNSMICFLYHWFTA